MVGWRDGVETAEEGTKMMEERKGAREGELRQENCGWDRFRMWGEGEVVDRGVNE